MKLNFIRVKNSTQTPSGFTLYHDLYIKASAELMYQAVSQPEHLINWWPLKCSGTPQVSTEYNFNFTDEYNWYGKVITAKPNEAFHIKMTKSDEDWNHTSFGFDLEAKEDHVHLKFWHSGWPNCNAHFRHSSYCWAILLHGLKSYVERGIVVPFEERN